MSKGTASDWLWAGTLATWTILILLREAPFDPHALGSILIASVGLRPILQFAPGISMQFPYLRPIPNSKEIWFERHLIFWLSLGVLIFAAALGAGLLE